MARRRRYGRLSSRRSRVLVRRGERALVFRGRAVTLLVLVALAATAVVGGVLAGLVLAGAAAAALLVLLWLAVTVRLRRVVSARPRGNGPTPPGGAAMREPRRPLPKAPAGAAERAIPDDDPPRRAVAIG